MSEKIHFAVRQDPIAQHGLDQLALCGKVIIRAHPVVIVPDAIVVSVGMIADQFGYKMCKYCKLSEPGEGYVYFLSTAEQVEEMRRKLNYADAV